MTYVDFSEDTASGEDNTLLGFLNSVLTRRGPISLPLRIALIPLLMGLVALPTAWAVPSYTVIDLGAPYQGEFTAKAGLSTTTVR